MINTHHIIEIPETNRTLYVPKELAHCNEREYILMCDLLWQWNSKQINFEEFKILSVYKLLNLKPTKKQLNKLDNDAKNSNIYQLSNLINDFFDEVDGSLQIKQNYTHNHVKRVRHVLSLYNGPEDEFNNVTFGQYEDGLNLYHLFSLERDVELLYMLMATFYLPKGRKYDSSKTSTISQSLKKIDFGVVYGFYLFFGAFQLYLTSSKVYWQGKEIDLSIIFSSDGKGFKSDLPDLGGKSIGFYLAKLDIFGSVDKVRKTNIWEIMLALYDIRKEHLDEKAKEKQLSNTP